VKESQSRMVRTSHLVISHKPHMDRPQVECCMLPSHTNAVGWHFWSSGNFCMSKFQKANQTPSLHVRFVREDLGSMHADLHLHAHVHWVYEYMCAHMGVYVCVCIYACRPTVTWSCALGVRVHICAHVCACMCMYLCMYACSCVCVHTGVLTCVCMCMHPCCAVHYGLVYVFICPLPCKDTFF